MSKVLSAMIVAANEERALHELDEALTSLAAAASLYEKAGKPGRAIRMRTLHREVLLAKDYVSP